MTVEAIKEAIAGLSDDEKAAVASWLSVQTMDQWDRQMQRDFAPGGRGERLVERVSAEIRSDRALKLQRRN
jgi:hypothetical protein